MTFIVACLLLGSSGDSFVLDVPIPILNNYDPTYFDAFEINDYCESVVDDEIVQGSWIK